MKKHDKWSLADLFLYLSFSLCLLPSLTLSTSLPLLSLYLNYLLGVDPKGPGSVWLPPSGLHQSKRADGQAANASARDLQQE